MQKSMTWSKIKSRMKIMGFKKASESHTEKEYRGLFFKGEKACTVRKVKRGKLIFVSWFKWTNIEPTETLINETYMLEECDCTHKVIQVEKE